MKSQILVLGLMCAILLLTGSCSSVGRSYNFKNVSALKLGELDSQDYVALFGQPKSKRTFTQTGGKYEFATYEFMQEGIDNKGRFRWLSLEFKNGKLNAYDFLSCFNEDQTTVDNSKIDAIRKGVNKFTREDVKSLAGQPNGEAKFPTELGEFKSYSRKANEVWVWIAADKIDFLGRDKGKLKLNGAFVLFGDDGKVCDVQTEEFLDSIWAPSLPEDVWQQ